MKKIFNLSVLLFIICTFYWACKKDQTVVANKNTSTEEQQSIANAKTYFLDSVDISIDSNQSSPNPRKNAKAAQWDSASIVQLSIGKAVLVPVLYNKPFYVSGNISGNARYNINQLAKLLIYQDTGKRYHAELVTFLPDSNFKGHNTYSGFVFIEDWKFNTIKRYKIENDKKIYELTPDTTKLNSNIKQQSLIQPDAQVVQICTIFYGYNYSPTLNEGYTYTEETCGYNIIFDEIHITNIPNGNDYSNLGGQVIGTASSYVDAKQNIVDGRNLEFEFANDTPPIDLVLYFNCFGSVPDDGAVYSAKLCVDIPVNNDPLALLDGTTPGHAFITVTKTNGSQSATLTFGFYPATWLNVTMSPVASEIKDDGAVKHEYNASIVMNNISQADFQTLENIAETLANSMKYDLNDYNCTNYALDVFNSIEPLNSQIVVPDWIGPYTGINYGTTPNGLWKVLGQMKSNGNSNVDMGVMDAPTSSGPCAL